MAFRRTTLAALLALLGLGMLPASDPAQARLGLGGGIGVGGWGSGVGFGGYRFGADTAVRAGYVGYHPVYGAGVRAGVGVTAAGADFYARPYAGFHPAWVNGGYWGARPWSAGWYQVNPTAWDWWGPSAAAWGLSELATGAAITSLVNQAAAQQSPVITVPQTTYTLNYGSVEAVGSQGASFYYSVDGGPQLFGGANCSAGLVDGQPPASAAEAQLLNAVCQVAYGAAA
ncbi:hypothetical protein [Synechococcus sp. RedBA-s]|uniref:hypothetical protein n=1 Tax=Synechococcus sp. RedBA-s TaxID=2823741 RepID=UPI0020CD453A|nr:hypothetical protein [Synechococcus sp. RedBA-s]MCP9800239.1 hypothetical protein [Synechococcus sp. RedBA-s]